ncbi:hypothetical protein WDJ51_14215 [Rathayibacter sp. YIM 133350]|uniref:hypothetical protein n=1 Tax=Rathayibacter sp. YIM 133350 TaxID=3131992 RepID=UPI00307DD9E3
MAEIPDEHLTIRAGERPSNRMMVAALWVAGTVFNVAFGVFFVLYSIADEWAVERSEAFNGFDPAQLLPHDVLLWLAAHLALVALVAVDVLAIMLTRMRRRARVGVVARIRPEAQEA